MLPTVPESALDRTESRRLSYAVSRIGGSLMGSSALAVMAAACLLFITGMTASNVTVSQTTKAVAVPTGQPGAWAPDSTRMLWIKNVVDEPVQFHTDAEGSLDGLTPRAGAAQSTTC
jgi:hypothetical protein